MKTQKPKLFCSFEGGNCGDFYQNLGVPFGLEGEGRNWSTAQNLEALSLSKSYFFVKILNLTLYVSIFIFLLLVIGRPEMLDSAEVKALGVILLVLIPCLHLSKFLNSVIRARKYSEIYILSRNFPVAGFYFMLNVFLINFFVPVNFVFRNREQDEALRISGVKYVHASVIYLFVWLLDSFALKAFAFFFALFPALSKRNFAPSRNNKTRVLHCTCSFDWGGSQKQIFNLCSSDSKGIFSHNVCEIFFEQNRMCRKDESFCLENYKNVPCLLKGFAYFCASPDLRSYKSLQIFKFYADFIREKPDIVVGWGHEICALVYIAAIFAKIPRIIFCIRTQNPKHYGNELEKVLWILHKKMFPNLSCTIVNSSVLKKDHSEWLGVSRDRIHVCPNGILTAPEKYLPDRNARDNLRNCLGISEKDVMILNVGRFSPEKGQLIMVQAAELTQRKIGNLHWFFCGDGPTKYEIELYIKKHGIERIHFAGAVSNVERYYNAADIFVMPSDFEGQPNAMMEAMAWGLPCISTNFSGAVDIADDGKEALFIPPRNSEALVEKIRLLIANPELMKALGCNAALRIKNFSNKAMIDKFNAIIVRQTGYTVSEK